MDASDADREEVDRLIHRMATDRPTRPSPTTGQPVERDVERRPGSRWTNVRVVMPSRPTPSLAARFALPSGIGLPHLPDLPHLFSMFSMPGQVTMVRLWVGLGAVHCALMTVWPYPKTYLWGLVLYLLSLALVLVTGVWGARLSWDERLGAAHTVALCTVLWAVRLATATVPPI